MKVLVLQMTPFHGSLNFHENANKEDKETINAFHNAWQQHQKTALGSTVNSLLINTSIRRTPCVGPRRFSVILL